MVSFVCSDCGNTLKKKAVASHRCYSQAYSCLDCGKEFYGNDYNTHTSCISEAQKYQKSVWRGDNKKIAPPSKPKPTPTPIPAVVPAKTPVAKAAETKPVKVKKSKKSAKVAVVSSSETTSSKSKKKKEKSKKSESSKSSSSSSGTPVATPAVSQKKDKKRKKSSSAEEVAPKKKKQVCIDDLYIRKYVYMYSPLLCIYVCVMEHV